MSDDPKKRRALPILVILGVVIVGLTVVFGVTSMDSSRVFSEYRDRTLHDDEHPPPWTRRELGVDECISFALDWATACPGIQSWCEAEVPSVMVQCLESADRTAYCDEVGDEILTTGFGFHDCEDRRESVTEKYAKRWHKKYCAKSYRTIADYCRRARDL